jgi:hypothetical protein
MRHHLGTQRDKAKTKEQKKQQEHEFHELDELHEFARLFVIPCGSGNPFNTNGLSRYGHENHGKTSMN